MEPGSRRNWQRQAGYNKKTETGQRRDGEGEERIEVAQQKTAKHQPKQKIVQGSAKQD